MVKRRRVRCFICPKLWIPTPANHPSQTFPPFSFSMAKPVSGSLHADQSREREPTMGRSAEARAEIVGRRARGRDGRFGNCDLGSGRRRRLGDQQGDLTPPF